MNQKSYLKRFAGYSFLSVLGTLGVSCYILADTYFISKRLGANGLAALNIAIPVYNFIFGIGLMLGMGGATKFSICKNSGERKQADVIFTNTVYPAVLLGIAFALGGWFFSRPLAAFIGADAEILEMTDIYLKWLMLFSPAFIMNNVLLCFVRNDENPTLSTAAMLIGSFANIIFDYIFIFPLQMGIFGAVLATGSSPIISMIIMAGHFLTKRNTFRLRKPKMYWNMLRQECSLGFPSLIAQVASGVVMIIFNMLVFKQAGNAGIAAYGVLTNLSLVIIAVYTGISQGVQPLISESYGAGDQKHMHRGFVYSMVTVAIVSGVIYLILFTLADPVTHVFNSGNNQALQEIAVPGLKLYFSSVLFVGFNTVLGVFFTSTERTIPAHVLSLLRGLILIIPLAFLFSAWWGLSGIWLAYPVAEGTVAVMGWAVYRRMKNW